jgi:hypothetical protein
MSLPDSPADAGTTITTNTTPNVTATITPTTLPQHIRKEWLPVLARLQQFAGTQAGIAVIKMTVVVDANGDPICWLEPDMTRFEPRSREKIIRDLFFSP